jgi:hypothetical protein
LHRFPWTEAKTSYAFEIQKSGKRQAKDRLTAPAPARLGPPGGEALGPYLEPHKIAQRARHPTRRKIEESGERVDVYARRGKYAVGHKPAAERPYANTD